MLIFILILNKINKIVKHDQTKLIHTYKLEVLII